MASFSICGSSASANVGVISCDRRKSIPKKPIIGGKQFSDAEYASTSVFDAAMLAAFKLANGDSNKLFPFPDITGVTDKTEAAKEGTLGAFGPKVTFVAAKPGYEFDVVAGSSLERELKKFNGQQVPVFIMDDSGAVWGDYVAGEFIGSECIIHTTEHKFGDAQNGNTTKISISAVSADAFQYFMTTDLSATEMTGLLDAVVEEVETSSNVITATVKIKTSNPSTDLNVYDSYSTELADEALWTAEVVATGAALTITSVAANAGESGWDVTIDSTEWTALSSGATVELNLASPTTLDAADVSGIEGTACIVTK